MSREKRNQILQEIGIGVIVAIITCVLTHYFTIREIKYQYELDIDNLDVDELLEKAQNYYELKDYLKVINIYNNEKLADNPIALYNLAYFYTEGIGVEQNIDKAEKLFYNAYVLDKKYIGGYIAIKAFYPESIGEINKLINQGIEENDYGTIRYINAVLYAQYPEKGYNEQTFLSMENERQCQVLENDIIVHNEWLREEPEENDFKKYIKDFKRKEQIGTYESDSGEIRPLYGTVKYKLYQIGEFKNNSCFERNIQFVELDE